MHKSHFIENMPKGRVRIGSQIGTLTFLKNFPSRVGRSQHSSEPSYIIGIDDFDVTLRSIFLIIT